jgi:hypothetical protein
MFQQFVEIAEETMAQSPGLRAQSSELRAQGNKLPSQSIDGQKVQTTSAEASVVKGVEH